VSLFISPRSAEIRELFPEPTEPTTAANCPGFMCRFIPFNVGASSTPQEKDPFSIVNGFAGKQNT